MKGIRHPLPPGWNKHPPLPSHAHAVITSVMPVWQIAVFATAAALVAAALAMTVYRVRVTRQNATSSTA
jgi:biopolymer transport protein ExbB/TolQ